MSFRFEESSPRLPWHPPGPHEVRIADRLDCSLIPVLDVATTAALSSRGERVTAPCCISKARTSHSPPSSLQCYRAWQGVQLVPDAASLRWGAG